MSVYKIQVTGADYIEDPFRIRLFGKNEHGESVAVLVPYNSYLILVPEKMEEDLKDKIGEIEKVLKIEETKKDLKGEERDCFKICSESYSDLSDIRDSLAEIKNIEKKHIFEYNINPYKRFFIDEEIKPGSWIKVSGEESDDYDWDFDVTLKSKTDDIKLIEENDTDLKILAFDTESYEDGDENRLCMLSLYGENVKKVITSVKGDYPKYVEVVKDEKEILEKFMDYVKEEDPDIITTYNGDSWDFKILREVAERTSQKLAISRDGTRMKFSRRLRSSAARVNGRVHIDLLNFVRNILRFHLETETYSLDIVSNEILGEGKDDFQYGEIINILKTGENIEEFARYSLKDSELTYKLSKELMPQIFELSKLVNQIPFDVSRMAYSQLVEMYLMKKAFEKNHIIPNSPHHGEIQKRRKKPSFTGGFVKEPKEGFHENIGVVDFRSLYPTIIASHNISPETYDCGHKKCEDNIVPDTKHQFCTEKEGFFSSIISELVEERQKIKDKIKKGSENLKLQERALKTVANAGYGYLGYSGSRWYCYECAESAAAYGRHYINKTIEEAEDFGFNVLYADTDSCFVYPATRKKLDEFLDRINDTLPGIMSLDFQGLYETGLFIPKGQGKGAAKKKYALFDGEKLTIVGLEAIRKDWCNLAKEIQKEILTKVLKERDIEGAVKYMQKRINDLKEKKVDLKDLILYTRITKPVEEYKRASPHVSAAKKMKEKGRKVSPGMTILYIVTEGDGSISDRAEPYEFVEIKNIDYDYYIDNQILPAALRVLQVFDVDGDLLKENVKQKTIEKYFGDNE